MTARVQPTRRPAAPTRPEPVRPAPSHPGARGPTSCQPAPPPLTLDPDERTAAAQRLTAAIGRWYLDAQAGRVEVRQLRRLLTPRAEHRVRATVLRARAAHRMGGGRPGPRLEVRRVVVHETPTHYEALALVDDGTRTVAVTAVLHATQRGWRISDLCRPDDGVPALPLPLLRELRGGYDPDGFDGEDGIGSQDDTVPVSTAA